MNLTLAQPVENDMLYKLSNEQLAPLLAESEHAFLASRNHPGETASSLNQKFKNDQKYNALGHVIDGRAVSYIIALSGRTDDEIAIGPMYVAEDYRSRGLGKRQIADFINSYAAQGYDSVYTKTWAGNAASRHSFESLGFSEADRENDDRINGDATISYTLKLINQNLEKQLQ